MYWRCFSNSKSGEEGVEEVTQVLTVLLVDNIFEDQHQKVLISHKERNRDGTAPAIAFKERHQRTAKRIKL